MATYAEAYEEMRARATKRDPLANAVCDCMEDAAESVMIEDQRALEFSDGSIYLPEHDVSFEARDGATDYLAEWRYESESDARDLNATADYMLGRTGR